MNVNDDHQLRDGSFRGQSIATNQNSQSGTTSDGNSEDSHSITSSGNSNTSTNSSISGTSHEIPGVRSPITQDNNNNIQTKGSTTNIQYQSSNNNHFDNDGLSESKKRFQADDEAIERPNFLAAFINLLKYVLGAGILAVPFAFGKAGLITSILTLIVLASAVYLSFLFLLWSSKRTNAYGYEELGEYLFGNGFSIFVKLSIIIDGIGSLTSYIITIQGLVDGYLVSAISTPMLRRFIVGLVIGAIALPLSSIRNIKYLRFTSTFAVIPILAVLLVEIWVLYEVGQVKEIVYFGSLEGFFIAIPILIFSFACQQAFYPVYTEFRNQSGTKKQMSSIVTICMIFTFLCISYCGLMGDLAFSSDVDDNILKSFPQNFRTHFLRFFMAFSVILSYPIMLWPCKVSLEKLIFKNSDKFPKSRSLILASGTVLVTLIISILIPKLSTIIGLTGALTCTLIGFLLPSLYYFKSNPIPFTKNYKKWLAVALFVFGLVSGIVSTVLIVIDAIEEFKND